ncbi:MAG TPA: hypothetical protein V6D28_21875 [Leptolyngbyaceae cyanobacterium]
MTTWKDPYTRQISTEEQQLYQHLLHLAQVESPSKLVERFHSLFIDGVGYPDNEVLVLLDKITNSKHADQEFKFVLNRCCHIMINRWQMHPQHQSAIPALISLFENSPVSLGQYSYRSRSVRRLHELIKTFLQSEQYLTLRRLSQVMMETAEVNSEAKTKPLGTLIRRYPYLYEHCLLSEDSTYEQQESIRQMQAQAQAQFEVKLSQYVTYQVRRAQVARAQDPNAAKRIIQPVKNPTLLTDGELFGAIKQYTGKVEGSYTYRDYAHSFLNHTSKTRSFRSFKDDLYSYLTTSIDPDYGKRQFNKKLYNHLQNTLSHNDSQQVNEFLLIRTCTHLLNFLVVHSNQQPQHFVFIDLVANLGINITIGLLLKIILICRKVKPYLEKRFSILFNHYESDAGSAVMWLIQSLENLNVALSIHFGAVDLSYLKQLR